MNFKTMMVVALAMLCVAGCKYSKMGKGAGAAAGDGNATGSDISTTQGGAMEGDLNSMGERHFEDYLTRCTDVNFEPVYFGFDSTVVPQAEMSKIDAVVNHLTEKTDRVVVIEGNCDERGSNEYNMSLGENRAIIIRNYLVQGGIASDRIQTRSYGEEKPAIDGHDESAWQKNRRGEFAIFQK